MDSTYEKEYQLNHPNSNSSEQLGLLQLLSILQDLAGEHATKLGFGYEDSLKKGFFWVLARQKLKIEVWPNLNEVLTIRTWTKPVLGIFAIREYELYSEQTKIGACSTTWMILDVNTRRPKRIENSDNLFKPRIDNSLDFSASKIKLPEHMKVIKTYAVKATDLDRNDHVNNTIYTKWVLDAIPNNYQQFNHIKAYEINFSEETFLDDVVEILSSTDKPSISTSDEVYFKANRIEDLKAVFTARILAESRKT